VCFTRNPATGAKQLYGEYLPNAQGEDVVAGIRTPLDVAHVSAAAAGFAAAAVVAASAPAPRRGCFLAAQF
jgi:predicted RecA/RadA family phage recombinase